MFARFTAGIGLRVAQPSCAFCGLPISNFASAENRTRVTSMATMYSATRPLMLPTNKKMSAQARCANNKKCLRVVRVLARARALCEHTHVFVCDYARLRAFLCSGWSSLLRPWCLSMYFVLVLCLVCLSRVVPCAVCLSVVVFLCHALNMFVCCVCVCLSRCVLYVFYVLY